MVEGFLSLLLQSCAPGGGTEYSGRPPAVGLGLRDYGFPFSFHVANGLHFHIINRHKTARGSNVR